MFAKLVAARDADDVLVEDMLGAGRGVGQDDAVGDGCGALGCGHGGDAGAEEELIVVCGKSERRRCVPGVDMGQLDEEDGGLQGVEP